MTHTCPSVGAFILLPQGEEKNREREREAGAMKDNSQETPKSLSKDSAEKDKLRMKRETLQAELLHTTSSANNDIDDVDGANVDEGQCGENSGSLRGNREADERSHSISKYAAQCGKCFKWRLFDTQVEFEDIRSKFIEEPFYCDRKPNVSCEDPADIEYNASRTWVIDKPNIPKTPEGFKRILIVRKDFSKLDSYYSTPTGKKCRTRNEIAQFIKENPEYEDVSLADFDFSTPKIMEETIPEHVVRKASANGSSNKRLKSIEG